MTKRARKQAVALIVLVFIAEFLGQEASEDTHFVL
jgi:hypothetical protein